MNIVISFIALIVLVTLLYKLFQWDAHPRSKTLRALTQERGLDYQKVGIIQQPPKQEVPLFLQSGQYHHAQHLGQGSLHNRQIKFFDYALFGTQLAGKPFTVLKVELRKSILARFLPQGTFRTLELRSDANGWQKAAWLGQEWQANGQQVYVKGPTDPNLFSEALKQLLTDYPGVIVEFLEYQLWVYKPGSLLQAESLLPTLETLIEQLQNIDKS